MQGRVTSPYEEISTTPRSSFNLSSKLYPAFDEFCAKEFLTGGLKAASLAGFGDPCPVPRGTKLSPSRRDIGSGLCQSGNDNLGASRGKEI
jgi:hypothetical protein